MGGKWERLGKKKEVFQLYRIAVGQLVCQKWMVQRAKRGGIRERKRRAGKQNEPWLL